MITGHTRSGKTTLLEGVVKMLDKNNIHPGGFFATARYQEKEHIGFDLCFYGENTFFPLASNTRQTGWMDGGHFWFCPETIEKGLEHLNRIKDGSYALVIIDEIGIFELEDKIWGPGVTRLTQQTSIPLLLVVREKLVKGVSEKWDLEVRGVWKTGEQSLHLPGLIARAILQDLSIA